MASQTTLDDVIATVMSMGFELDDCQQAVQYGKITAEEIVEWILSGKPGLAAMPSQTPRLQLGRMQATEPLQMSSNPFVSPIPVQQEPLTNSSNSAMETDSNVVSRHHLTDNKRKDKELFEEKQREEARKRARDEKQAQRQEKERILKQIEEDKRDKKKDMGGGGASMSSPSKVTPSSNQTPNTSTTSPAQPESSTEKTTTLQIRLPNGRTLRQKFQTDSTLNDVWDFCYKEFNSMPSMSFIQPFPRRDYNKEDLKETLLSLGLTPNGSLVVKPSTVTEQASSAESMDEGQDKSDSEVMEEDDPVRSRLRHTWGQGHRLETEELDQPEEEALGGIDEAEEDFGLFANQNFPQAQFPGMPFLHDQANQVFGGVGQRLLPEGHPDADVVQNRPAGQVAAEAALNRFKNPVVVDHQPTPQPTSIFHTVKSLLNIVFHHLADRLDDSKGQVVCLSGMSEDLAQKLISYFIKQQILKPRILKAFIPCYLRKLVLDCYPLTTNEILQSVRLHSNLSVLSLNSCPLITDLGLQSIAGMKKLKVLNLGSCPQLTNRCLVVLKDLPSLISLNLMKTGINDTGVTHHLIPYCKLLQYLNLNGTAVTHTILPPLKVLSQLKELLLEDTKVCSLSGIEHLTSIQHLDISHTHIFTDSLLCLTQLCSLVSLNIAGTDQVHGDLALQYLKGLKLQNINLPSRHSTTGVGMSHITSFPLVRLDLTNYVNIGDEGICHVGKLHTLKILLLSNTKLTDHGIQFLHDLKDLEVLNLDRTSITDVGAGIIKEFHKLQELSLSATGITSRLLTNGILNNLHYLSKLNLSKTNINDKGIVSLKLRSLTLINLDSTRVHPSSLDLLKEGCPELQRITLQNLAPVNEEEEEMEG